MQIRELWKVLKKVIFFSFFIDEFMFLELWGSAAPVRDDILYYLSIHPSVCPFHCQTPPESLRCLRLSEVSGRPSEALERNSDRLCRPFFSHWWPACLRAFLRSLWAFWGPRGPDWDLFEASQGLKGCLKGRLTYRYVEFLAILQDFVLYWGCCPKRMI